MFKIFRGHKYKWAASRRTESQADNVKDRFNKTGKVHAVVIPKKLGSPTALVPTVYEIWVRPTENAKEKGYLLNSSLLETFIRVEMHHYR